MLKSLTYQLLFLFWYAFQGSSLLGEGFPGGTLVKTSSGYVPIEHLQASHKIICYGFKGRCVEQTVTQITKKHVSELVELKVGEENIYVASDHLFFLPRERKWVEAKDIRAGDTLLSHCTDLVTVTYARLASAQAEVYDIAVAKYHNFCVSYNDIHVHNFLPMLGLVISWAFGAGTGGGLAITGSIGLGSLALGYIIGDSQERRKETIFRRLEGEAQRVTHHEARRPEDYPPGYDKDTWKKVNGGPGFIDPDGNIWAKDMKHRRRPQDRHWDVNKPNGKRIKEVDEKGNQIWPNGNKNKNRGTK
jgi:hypothetical protein